MSLYAATGGVSRELKKFYAEKDGVNREIKELWAAKDGANRKVFSGSVCGVHCVPYTAENAAYRSCSVTENGIFNTTVDATKCTTPYNRASFLIYFDDPITFVRGQEALSIRFVRHGGSSIFSARACLYSDLADNSVAESFASAYVGEGQDPGTGGSQAQATSTISLSAMRLYLSFDRQDWQYISGCETDSATDVKINGIPITSVTII